jgi:hypothetical protein
MKLLGRLVDYFHSRFGLIRVFNTLTLMTLSTVQDSVSELFINNALRLQNFFSRKALRPAITLILLHPSPIKNNNSLLVKSPLQSPQLLTSSPDEGRKIA